MEEGGNVGKFVGKFVYQFVGKCWAKIGRCSIKTTQQLNTNDYIFPADFVTNGR